ncbi:uncharacterized protein METZ01_LOCUS215429, partial [marine metagenome]
QYTVLHPEFSFLPRKFKIAVTGSPKDRAAVALHDIGLRMHLNDSGKLGFEVLIGGGQGRTPVIAKTIREWLSPEHLMAYVEAILRVYNLNGRRDNIHKARIKIIVNQLGIDRYRELVDQEFDRIKGDVKDIPEAEIQRIKAYFAPPEYEELPDFTDKLNTLRLADKAFDLWISSNVAEHKIRGYAIVNLTLKAPDRVPGDITATAMDAVADLADEYSLGEMRVNHRQNLVFVDVKQMDLHGLWKKLGLLELATPNLGQLTDMITCPGLDYCNLANARSIPVAQDINKHFVDVDRLVAIGDFTVNISGCMNACGHHHVGNVGILGVDKHGTEFFQLTLGGSSDEGASLGDRLGRALPQEEVPAAIEAIVDTYMDIRKDDERFLDTYRRIGMVPFKEAVYGSADTKVVV